MAAPRLFRLPENASDDTRGIAATAFSPVELIEACADPGSNLGQLIQECPALQFT